MEILKKVAHVVTIEFPVDVPVELSECLVRSLRDDFHIYWSMARQIEYSFNNPQELTYPEISIERL